MVRYLDPDDYLEPWLAALGGPNALPFYPQRALRQLILHPGKKHVIFKDHFALKLSDVKSGYSVYDENLVFQHSVLISPDAAHAPAYDGVNAADVVIGTFLFGMDLRDSLLVTAMQPGTCFYLSYQTLHPGGVYETQVDLVVLSPLSALDVF